MQNPERDSVKKKISALLAKTPENGASEHEALAAAQKAAELMAVYDIEATELDYKNNTCVKRTIKAQTYARHILGNYFALAIQSLCDCIGWNDNGTDETVFFGFEQDADIAIYLYSSLRSAVVMELANYKESPEFAEAIAHGEMTMVLCRTFILGMEMRISQRLKQMAAEKKATVQVSTGTSLVLVKTERVQEEFADLGMKLRSGSRSRAIRKGSSAYAAGQKAGDRVNISKGVGSTVVGALS